MDPLLSVDPEHIGRYRPTHRPGAGGTGQVHLAQTPSGRRIVVEVIRPEYVKDDGFRARFALEAEAARRVGGFHTAQVVDADPDAPLPWIATAYIEGPSLDEAVQDRGSWSRGRCAPSPWAWRRGSRPYTGPGRCTGTWNRGTSSWRRTARGSSTWGSPGRWTPRT